MRQPAATGIVFALLLLLVSSVYAEAPEKTPTGTLTGRFLLKGELPQLKPRVEKGAAIKNAAICAAAAIPNESLVVNPKNKGIANIFIYLKKSPEGMPEKFRLNTDDNIKLNIKNCRYYPHAFCLQTNQGLRFVTSDDATHNPTAYPLRNNSPSFLMAPKEAKGIVFFFPKPELLPIRLSCDFHPWMSAYALILDHPYMAVSDADGKFTIKNLPEGDHEFRIWHEAVGYVDRTYKVTIKRGETTQTQLAIPLEKFDLPK